MAADAQLFMAQCMKTLLSSVTTAITLNWSLEKAENNVIIMIIMLIQYQWTMYFLQITVSLEGLDDPNLFSPLAESVTSVDSLHDTLIT